MKIKSLLTQKILKLSIPVLLGMISYTAIQVADTFMVSSLGEEAIASTGIGGLVYFTVLSFLMNGSVGIQILTSRRLGEKREREIGKILVTILLSGFIIGFVMTLIGFQISEYLISLISEDNRFTPNAIKYLSLRFLGTIFFVLLYVLRGFFDGLGQTYIGMIAAFVSMFSNIFLNWVFIYGNLGVVPMGVEGAAIASSLAGGLGLMVFLGFLIQKKIRYFLNLSGFALEWGVLKNIFTIGFPSALDGSLTNISFLIFNKIAALISVSSVAGSQVIFSVLTISFMPGMAFGVAATTILGSGMGSGKFHLAEAGTYRCAKFSAIIMGFLGILFILFGKEILFLFGNNPGLVQEAYPALVAVSLVQVGDAYHMVLGAALRSAGFVLWVPLVYFCVSYFVMIPVAYLLGIVMGFGTTGLWSSISIWLLCMFSLFLWKFKLGTWKQKVI